MSPENTATIGVIARLRREVPTRDTSHRDILFQAAGELPGVRPAVVPSELIDDLLEPMAFRHFFRHAYTVYFDSSRLGSLLDRLATVAPQVESAPNDFDAFLEQALIQVAK